MEQDIAQNAASLLSLIKMCLVHDLAEAITGDTPYTTEANRMAKKQKEDSAMRTLTAVLPDPLRREVYGLWLEFEENATSEAKCARSLDGLEAQLQHNIAPIETWEPREYELVYTKLDGPCRHDATLAGICDMIKLQAEDQIRNAGIAVDEIQRRIA